MTGDLVPPFKGKEIRVVEYAGEVWMPCRDLSLALGLDRTTLYQHVSRNKDFFEGCAQTGDILSQETGDIWLNEQGLYLMLARVSLGRVLPVAKAAIIKFRKEVPELIQRYRKKEIVQVVSIDGIKAELQQAKEYAGVCERDVGSFQAAVFKKYGMTEFADVLRPAIVHGETGWYNPTRLVSLCNDPDLTPERLNWYLKNKGFQYRDGYIWRLTPAGLIHGREYNFEAPSGHVEVRIAWRESVLYASGLKRPISSDRASLTAKAGS